MENMFKKENISVTNEIKSEGGQDAMKEWEEMQGNANTEEYQKRIKELSNSLYATLNDIDNKIKVHEEHLKLLRSLRSALTKNVTEIVNKANS